MNDVTICIKTFNRPQALERCVRSVRKFYPDTPVLVGDDSEHALPETMLEYFRESGVRYHRYDYDIGLSEGRNQLVDNAATPFSIILEDDFVFTRRTNIGHLLSWVEADVADLVGGMVLAGGARTEQAGYLSIIGNGLFYTRSSREGPAFCDVVLNFIGARTSTLRNIRWDPELKLGEHLDFFIRAKEANTRVLFVPSVEIDHVDCATSLRSSYEADRREKAYEYRERFYRKYGIDSVSGFWIRRDVG